MTSINIFEALNVLDTLQFIIVFVVLHVLRYLQIRDVLWGNKLAIQHSWLLTCTSLLGLLLRSARPLGWITAAQVGSDVAAWCLMMCLWLLPLTLIHGLTQTALKMSVPKCTYGLHKLFGVFILLLFVVLETVKVLSDSRLLDAVMLIVFSVLTLLCFTVSLTATFFYESQNVPKKTVQKLLTYHRAAGCVFLCILPLIVWRITVLFETHARGEKLLVPDRSSEDHLVRLVLSAFLAAVLAVIYVYSGPTKYQRRQAKRASGEYDVEAAQVYKPRPTGAHKSRNHRLINHLRCVSNRSRQASFRPPMVSGPMTPPTPPSPPVTSEDESGPHASVPRTALPRSATMDNMGTTPCCLTAPVERRPVSRSSGQNNRRNSRKKLHVRISNAPGPLSASQSLPALTCNSCSGAGGNPVPLSVNTSLSFQ